MLPLPAATFMMAVLAVSCRQVMASATKLPLTENVALVLPITAPAATAVSPDVAPSVPPMMRLGRAVVPGTVTVMPAVVMVLPLLA